jgi:hypothetical protein
MLGRAGAASGAEARDQPNDKETKPFAKGRGVYEKFKSVIDSVKRII